MNGGANRLLMNRNGQVRGHGNGEASMNFVGLSGKSMQGAASILQVFGFSQDTTLSQDDGIGDEQSATGVRSHASGGRFQFVEDDSLQILFGRLSIAMDFVRLRGNHSNWNRQCFEDLSASRRTRSKNQGGSVFDHGLVR